MRLFGYEFPSVTGMFGAPSVNEVQSHQGGVPYRPTRDGVTRGWTYDPMDYFSPPAYGSPADTGPSGALGGVMAFLQGGGNPPNFNWASQDPRGYSPRVPDETGGVSYNSGQPEIPDETGGVSYSGLPSGVTIPDETGGVSFHPGIPATGGGTPPEYFGGDLSGLPYERPGDGNKVTPDTLRPGDDPTPHEYQRSKDQRFGRGVLGRGAAFLDGASRYFVER